MERGRSDGEDLAEMGRWVVVGFWRWMVGFGVLWRWGLRVWKRWGERKGDKGFLYMEMKEELQVEAEAAIFSSVRGEKRRV